MGRYKLRYFFDSGAGTCLWSANDASQDLFGYAVAIDHLQICENTKRRMFYVIAWYDTAINWTNPAGPSLWNAEELRLFNAEAQKLLIIMRAALGNDFEVVDESDTNEEFA